MRPGLLLVALTACKKDPIPEDTDPGDTDALSTCADGLSADDLEAGAWDPAFTVAGFAGHDGLAPTVYDFATDIDGSIVATGRFQWSGAEPIAPLMRWRDGAWEPARESWELTPDLNGFAAVAISPEGDLALATYDAFEERNGEIWLDDGSGLRSIGSFDGLVRSLAWYDGKLWIAGLFEMEGTSGLATWDGTWAPAPGGAIDGSAFELTVDGDALLVGGAFAEIGGVAAENVASFDGSAWTALDLPDGLAVYALARGGDGELYAGGAISDILSGAGGVARWDGAQWQLAGEGLSMYAWPGVVTDLAAFDGQLAATGCFAAINGAEGGPETEPARALALWDGTAWHAADDGASGVLSSWFEPGACGDEGLTAVWDVSWQRLASTGDELLLAGSFPGAGGVVSQAVIGYGADGWEAQGDGGLGLSGISDRVATAGEACDDVYVLGTFTHAGGEATRSRLLRFAGDAWEPVSDAIPGDAWCPALAASASGDVAVGCMEFTETFESVGRVYRVADGALVAVDAELGPIFTLAYDTEGTLWIGGGGEGGYLARLDGDALTVVEDGFDGPVTRIDVKADDDVIVGGSFLGVDGVDATRLARWDGTAWNALGDGAPGMVTALARDATQLYVSTYDEGAGAWLLGAWDGSAWTELATPDAGLTPQSYFNFERIEIVDDALVLAGSAMLDDGGRGVLVYRDGAFSALGGGVGGITIGDLRVTDEEIWVAGAIGQAGDGPTLTSTVGVARWELTR